MKKLTSWKGLKKGTKFKVIANTNSHNYPLNITLTMKKAGSDNQRMSDVAEEIRGNELNIKDCIFGSYTIKDIKEEQKELQSQINSLNAKIKVMEELELEEYDENVIKIHQTLTLIDKKGISKIEKAKAITKLINES